jgi:hypothetical protein
VQFRDSGANLGGALALSGGHASFATNTLLPAGSHSITASYSGDAGNSAATSAAFVETVTKAATSTSLHSSAASITANQALTLTAQVAGVMPGGSVTFTDGAGTVATATLAGGTASVTLANLGAGTHQIGAVYSGDANNLGSSAAPLTELVSNPASTGEGDAPTLPEWAMLVMGGVLAWMLMRDAPPRVRVDTTRECAGRRAP